MFDLKIRFWKKGGARAAYKRRSPHPFPSNRALLRLIIRPAHIESVTKVDALAPLFTVV